MKFGYTERQLVATETRSFTAELNPTTNTMFEKTIFYVIQSCCLGVILGKLYYPFEEEVLKGALEGTQLSAWHIQSALQMLATSCLSSPVCF